MNIEPSATATTSRRTRGIVTGVAIAVIATFPFAAGASNERAASEPTVPATVSSDGASEALEPTTETSTDGEIRLTFTVPDGWQNNGWYVAKSDADPIFGVVLFRVANIFVEPCQWVEVDPAPGPTVDDLVSAFANVPVLNASAATDVIVDGFHGKQIEFTVPEYDENECKLGRYALFQDADHAGRGPNYWAQGPHSHHRLWILDIDGIRYVIGGTTFPDTSERDREDLDTILDSIQIDVVEADHAGDDHPVETSVASSTSSVQG